MPIANFVAKKDYHLIGTIQKVQGLQGNLVVHLVDAHIALPTFKTLFVYKHATYVPYCVHTWEVNGSHALLKLTHIATRSVAEPLRGHSVFLPVKKIQEVSPIEESHAHWVGYIIEDVHQGVLGYVTDIYERAMQSFLAIDYKNRELLIPIHQVFIKEVDSHKKKIKVALPQDYIPTLAT